MVGVHGKGGYKCGEVVGGVHDKLSPILHVQPVANVSCLRSDCICAFCALEALHGDM